ncbi:B12-binding domain-containing radical SAM protein [Bradyrhizobium sp. WD16]|uniref:B12-binding domain-containing radical SAM protein n=1 Tax=Bradyrhizobium sp. WD16 TaxID=1521768 RepID=UPI0020A5652A|nr:B12-binding domain-containing radical SAM protein [Bradyrhizobium sp. WD16]UTD29273.1 B12-binding domain-containing radical SAM protein [Bradyrhizobium sp. WD16]
MAATRCNVLLVYPRFDLASFWSLTTTCEIAGKRRMEPPLGLITVAAMLPKEWSVRLIDRNAEDVTETDLAWADMVMTGGMIPQRADTLRLIELGQAHGKPVVVGGPDVTSSPQVYRIADFRMPGEVEATIDAFIEAWESGARQGLFEAEKFTVDVTRSPTPRFDLLKFEHYLALSVQFSRGCPFTCEFCDIIELYGRVPRAKATDQLLGELEILYQLGYRGHVDFVDDNLIGNKKAVKQFLPHLCAWQQARGFPFTFSTQASINLADDEVLLHLLRDANFGAVFIGIESPNQEALLSTRKKQNARRNLTDCVHRIYRAGMFVTAGFVVGFDSETDGMAEEMVACIEAAALPICMVGLLTALPQTQLSRRLEREGRLNPEIDFGFVSGADGGDQCTEGLNFSTARARRDVLADYRSVLERINRPEAFFARIRTVARLLAPARVEASVPWRVILNDAATVGRLLWFLSVRRPKLLAGFVATIAECAVRNPRALKQVVSLFLLYLHVGPFSEEVIASLVRQIRSIDTGMVLPEAPAMIGRAAV